MSPMLQRVQRLGQVVQFVTPTGLWELLGQRVPRAADPVTGSARVWWQAIVFLVMAMVTVALALLIYVGTPSAPQTWVAAWLLVDIVGYHARGLSRPRRILPAMIHFAESIALFGILYEGSGCMRQPPPAVFEASLAVATTLLRPAAIRGCGILTTSQAALSVFFVLVVLTGVATVMTSGRRQP